MGKRGVKPDLREDAAVLLMRLNGATFKEIGSIMGVSKERVWSRFRRAEGLFGRDDLADIIKQNSVKRTRQRLPRKTERKNYREDVLKHYGGDTPKCAMCGVEEKDALEIDHINEDGAKHRREMGGSTKIYRWIVVNAYPKDFQILCRNCNWIKYRARVREQLSTSKGDKSE